MPAPNTAVIVEAVRTARGKKKGSLVGTHPVDLLAKTLDAAVRRSGVDPMMVDDVVAGCVTQVGEQGLNVARGAVLAAGLPIELAGNTVNRFCGSGLQAVNYAAMQILSGQADLVIGGGVESMNRVPMGSDADGGEGPASPGLIERFPNLVPQGVSAELIAEQWKLTRGQLDEFAAASQQKAGKAIRDGHFKREIEPLQVTGPDGTVRTFDTDEHCRPNTTVEGLAALPAVFKPEGGVIHAGNSSGIVDGAAAVVVASHAKAKQLGLEARARILATAVAGSDPVLMLTGPIPSTRKALARAGLTVKDIDLWEINEAFAPVPIVVGQELGIPLDRINVNGGAIALGHPLGATGAILLTTALHELERRDLRRAAITLCIGYGMGITTIIDRQLE